MPSTPRKIQFDPGGGSPLNPGAVPFAPARASHHPMVLQSPAFPRSEVLLGDDAWLAAGLPVTVAAALVPA